MNPLVGAVPGDPVPGEYQLEFMSQSLLLPDHGALQGRLLVAAWSVGLDDVTQEAVEVVFEALQVPSVLLLFRASCLIGLMQLNAETSWSISTASLDAARVTGTL